MLKTMSRWLMIGTNAVIATISRLVVRYGSKLIIRAKVRVRVEGLDYVPRSGPVLLAARHYHNFYDGCILLAVMPRRIHLFVALDWIQTQRTRRGMEYICWLAQWPVSLREERLDMTNAEHGSRSVYTAQDVRRYVLHSSKQSVQLLRQGEVLVIFPEGYPNIDPAPNPKSDGRAFLPFQPGFARLVEMAERNDAPPVAIIPVGFVYTHPPRWRVTVRFGAPLQRGDFADAAKMVKAIEERVRALSTM